MGRKIVPPKTGDPKILQRQSLLWPVAFGLLLSACGQSANGTPQPDEDLTPRETAERIISNEMEEMLDLGDLDPICHDVPVPLPGTTFLCTADVDNRTLYISGQLEASGKVVVKTTNLLIPPDLPPIETAAATYISNRTGTAIAADSFNCGEKSIILNEEKIVGCEFTAPSGERYDAKIKILDIASSDVQAEIANNPK